MILASPKRSDAATLTGSTAQAGAPLSYLQRKQPGEIWASSGLSGVYLQLDMLTSDPWDLVWLGFHNGTREATWRIRAATSAANLTSSPTFDTGRALKLNGSSQYASQASLASSSAGLIEGWLRPRSLLSSEAIVVTGSTSGYIEIVSGSGSNQVVANYTGGVLASAADAISVMEWVHVAVLWSGGNVQLFLDGSLVASATNFAGFVGTVTVTLGNLGLNYFAGDIDEVRYWTVSRTADQIRANRYGPITTPTTGLVGYWKLDDAATNAGSAAGSLTLTGAPGYVHREPMWCSPRLDDFARRHAMLWLKTPGWTTQERTERYVRIDLDDPSGDAGDGIQAGRLYVSKAYQPSRNPISPAEPFSLFDPSSIEALPGGRSNVYELGVRPAATFTLELDDEDELFDDVYTLQRTRGASKDVLYCADPDVGRHRFKKIAYGLMQQRLGATVIGSGLYQIPFAISGLE